MLAGLSTMMPASVLAGNVAFTTDTPLIVPVSGIDLTVLAGSNADSVVLNSNTVTVTVSGSDTLRLQAPDNGRLENDKSLNPCAKVSGIVTLTVTSSNSPVVFTPSTTVCTVSTGGGSYAPSTIPDITLASPLAGSVAAGSNVSVSWFIGGQGIDSTSLAYSTDSGLHYTQIATGVPAAGPYIWTVPRTLSGQIILQVTGHDSGGLNLVASEVVLTVAAPTTLQTGPSPITGLVEQISEVKPGQYIRSNSFDTVYYVTSDYKRRPFWNSTTFFTWAKSFQEIAWITDATLPTLPMGTPMLPKSGVILVKIQSDPKTYEVELATDGTYLLHWLTSEDVARSRYGARWADYVTDLEPTLFTRYHVGPAQSDATAQDVSEMKTRDGIAQLVRGN